MGKQREGGIAWTDRTWNPVRGCSRVSEGCRNCYAERQAARFASPGVGIIGAAKAIPSERSAAYPAGPFYGFVQITNGHPQWTGKVELVEKHLEDPLHWRKPCKVFVNSMSDLFHEALPVVDIKSVFDVMRAAHWHTYQILTKRAARMLEIVGWLKQQYDDVYPLPNVWLGVSVEDQATADERIPLLLETPAAVRFVSYEPALSGVDFAAYLPHNPVYGVQGKREVRISSGSQRRLGDTPGREDMAREEARLGSVETGSSQSSVQTSESGARLRGILPDSGNDRQETSIRPGPSSSLHSP